METNFSTQNRPKMNFNSLLNDSFQTYKSSLGYQVVIVVIATIASFIFSFIALLLSISGAVLYGIELVS
ncbi:hypothetical protein AB4865_02570 [Capnocytophaga sp. ARDL2]|uniref:hypothetical protein n=1 Tax=Capnocytophaga sp. ARDL2 TaxID=3238809 RepID=UPI003556FEFE